MCERTLPISQHEKQMLNDFKIKHPLFFKNPLIVSFLKEGDHEAMLTKALVNPKTENENSLNEAFRYYYAGVKFVHLLSQTLYWEAVNHDKKTRNYKEKFSLILDGTTHEEVGLLETSEDGEVPLESYVIESTNNIFEKVENARLKEALESLTPKQKSIIQEVYGNGKNLTETGKAFGISPQSVSKIHKLALNKMHNVLGGDFK